MCSQSMESVSQNESFYAIYQIRKSKYSRKHFRSYQQTVCLFSQFNHVGRSNVNFFNLLSAVRQGD